MKSHLSRRDWILSTSAAAGVAALPVSAEAAEPSKMEPFGYCLNTSTIRGQGLPVDQKAEVAAKAGFKGFEPWIRELDEYVTKGGSLKDLGKKIADLGLSVESAIGFAEWIVDDDDRRRKALETANRDMEMVLAEVGAKAGIIPQVELWGFSKPLHKLGEVVFVAMESAHPQACILPDIYHIYKGGSEFKGLGLLNGNLIGIFHMNDYSDTFTREKIVDANRVYPGDGNGPLKQTIRTLRDIGYKGMLSLELFNPEYWKQDSLLVAKTGLEKMRAVVKASLS
ncbi:MAG: sugar phosphate isomerase/epimerase [Planctomycetes bacterium]|nr:sugar phosphate isomerase/epimerase [Planctomycetota bacterium]